MKGRHTYLCCSAVSSYCRSVAFRRCLNVWAEYLSLYAMGTCANHEATFFFENDIPNSGWLVSSLHMQKLWLTILDTSQTFSSCMQCKQSWMQTHHWQKQTHRKSGHLLCVSSINECCVWVWHLRKEQAIEDSNSQTVCQICAQKGLRVTQRPKPQ